MTIKKQPKPKRAFLCDTGEHMGCYIKFAHSANELLRLDEYEEVKPSPEWDRFAEQGYVPEKELLNAGWTVSCHECEKEINDEYWDYEEDVQLDPVFEGRKVYCSQECCDAFHRFVKESEKSKQEAINRITAAYPGITVKSAYGQPECAYVTFTFPGGQGTVDWRSNKPDELWVQRRDQDAWREFIAGLKAIEQQLAVTDVIEKQLAVSGGEP